MGEPNWQGKYNDALLKINDLEDLVEQLQAELAEARSKIAEWTANRIVYK